MSGPATRRALEALARPLRRLGALGWVALGVGAAALVLGGAAWLVRLHWIVTPWWVIAAWALTLLALGTLVPIARGRQRQLSAPRVARQLEEGGAWRNGALTALLEAPAPGTSAALLAAADASSAGDVGRRGGVALDPLRRSVRARGIAAAGLLVVGLAAFTSAGPMRGSAAALWHPRRAWEEALAPVALVASATSVDRGAAVDFEVRAIGRRSATLWLRSPGEGWTPRLVPLDSTGHARERVGPLRADLYARVTSGGRGSDTVLVHVRLPVFLGALTVTAHYPRYLHLGDEPLPTSGDTVLLPAGTRLDTRGEATAPLRAAAWRSGRGDAALEVDRRRFSGSFAPTASGTYELSLLTAGGTAIAGDTVRVPLRIVPDSAPVVEVPVPGADTTAPVGLTVPLVIDVRDDHGVAAVQVESRRISRLGFADSALRQSVALPSGGPDRAVLNATLDLNRRGLLPGDTVRYFVRATDNAPAAHVGRSREFVLRLPTLTEMRALQRQATAQVSARLDSVAAQSRKVERAAEDLAREEPRNGTDTPAASQDALKYDQAKKAEGVAASQEQLLKQAEELKQSIEQLKRSAEAAGLGDTAWQRRLDEIRDQIDRALTPELRQRLAELQQSLKELDPERAKESLEKLAEAQKELREALERSRELFRRAALEGDLANLAQESKELAQEERRWTEEVPQADSARAAAEERALAERADSLAASLQRTAQQAAVDQKEEPLQRAAEMTRQAGRQMRQGAKAAEGGQRQQAEQRGREAQKSLDPVGDELDQARKEMAQRWKQEVSEAIDRAMSETSRLTERQLAVEEGLKRGAPVSRMRAEQAAVQEGVERLLEQVKKTAGKNALVSPQIGTSLAVAQRQMDQASEALSSASPNPREAGERAGNAVDAMNAAAHQLARARGQVSGAGSGSGLSEALQQMQQMASQQGQLGQQGAGLLPMPGGVALQQALRRLGAQQRALAERLERMRGQGSMPGAGEMANEAKDVARQLESGRLDRQTVERQERLFRRMLDAGRTLQGHEEDDKKERQSTTARGDSVHLPPALRARLEDDAHRLRVPTWDELQRLTPAERRLVVDYFRRLAEPGEAP